MGDEGPILESRDHKHREERLRQGQRIEKTTGQERRRVAGKRGREG